jgi:hypothetical protein
MVISLLIREMKIKLTVKYHLTSTRLAIIKKEKGWKEGRRDISHKCW